jgi:hypothetical protein
LFAKIIDERWRELSIIVEEIRQGNRPDSANADDLLDKVRRIKTIASDIIKKCEEV